MPRRPAPLPPGLGTVFTRADAVRAGVGSRRLHAEDVQRICSGVYRRGDRDAARSAAIRAEDWCRSEHRARALDAGSYVPDGVFFCGRTAAALWGLPVSLAEGEPLEIAVLGPRRALTRDGFSCRTVRPRLARVVEHRGVRLTDPPTTWAMLAPALALRDGVAIGDAIIRRPRIPGTTRVERPPLASLDDLRAAANLERRPGAPRLRALLPLMRTGSASPPESHLRLLMRGWGLPDPDLDVDVYDRRGRLIGCSEIAYPELRLAFEYEGAHHRTDTWQWNRDIEKYRHYAQEGWEVIRVTADLLYARPEALRRQVLEAVSRRAEGCGRLAAGGCG